MSYGKTIGISMPLGFAGTISRMSDCVTQPYKYAASNTGNIQFGEMVAYDATNGGVRKMKATDTADDIIGIAVRHAGQPKDDTPTGWYYAPGETVDVLVRGTIMAQLGATTSVAARGTVYVDPATGLMYGATAAGYLTVSNAHFGNGKVDSDQKITEVTLLTRAV